MRLELAPWAFRFAALKNRRERRGATGLFAFVSVLLFVSVIIACGGSDIRGDRGRSLEVFVQPVPVKVYDRVAFVDSNGQTQVIQPEATNRQLAAVNVIVINRTSTTTSILVNSEAAQLGDRRAQRINALNPFEKAVPVDASGVSKGEKLLRLDSSKPDERFLWNEVSLARDFQIQGWMIFDVPKGLKLGAFWWSQVEDIVIDL